MHHADPLGTHAVDETRIMRMALTLSGFDSQLGAAGNWEFWRQAGSILGTGNWEREEPGNWLGAWEPKKNSAGPISQSFVWQYWIPMLWGANCA